MTKYQPDDLPLLDTWDWDKKLRDLVPVKRRPTGFVRDGLLVVSAEDGLGFADAYGQPSIDEDGNEYWTGTHYIDPRLEKWAEERGCYWEWETPGTIVLSK